MSSLQDRLGRMTAKPAAAPRVDGTALLERLARGRDLRQRMAWPGGQLEIELQVLTRAETAAAHAAAIKALEARGIDPKSNTPRAVEAMVDEELTQILARAVRDASTHEPLAASADELAAVATDDELVTLFNAYTDLRQSVDPSPEEMPEEEWGALLAAVKKKDASLLRTTVSSMPPSWLRTSVVRLATSLTPSSSSTESSSTSPSPPPPDDGEDDPAA